MAGLKGLTKQDRDTEHEELAHTFIKGATGKVKNLNADSSSNQNYKRFTFSLTEAVSHNIDELSFIPRQFRASRSDVIKAAIDLLKSQDEGTIIELLKNTKS